jgi:hypothetical protein
MAKRVRPTSWQVNIFEVLTVDSHSHGVVLQKPVLRYNPLLTFSQLVTPSLFMKHNSSPFKWRHYEAETILLCVRWWCCRYLLSYRDLEETMKVRRLQLDQTTVFRWFQSYAPAINKKVRPYLKLAGTS